MGPTLSEDGGEFGTVAHTSATCPAGETAISGGFADTVGSVLVSQPSVDLWIIAVFVPAGQTGTIRAIAVCAFVQ